jgi:hypothetical protein
MARLRSTLASILTALLLLAGCAPTASQLMGHPPTAADAAREELQARLYDTPDEGRILATCITLLQDMGFQVDEAASGLGVLSASKTRDANSLTPAERLGASVLFWGLLIGGYTTPLAVFLIGMDSARPMNIEVGIVTRKIDLGGGRVSVDVVFRENSVPVTDPAIYQEFFGQLSKALFLEARES